jgi:hypothetical protein
VIFRRTLCVFDNSHGRRARLFDVGVSPANQRKQVSALLLAAAIG